MTGRDWESDFMREGERHCPVRVARSIPTYAGEPALNVVPAGPLPSEHDGRFVRLVQKRDSGVSVRWAMSDGRTAPAYDSDVEHSAPTNFEERSKGLALVRNSKPAALPDFGGGPDFSFMISTRLLDLLLNFDPDAIMHAPVDYQFNDGSRPPPDRQQHLIFVRRMIHAADLDRTIVMLQRNLTLGKQGSWEPADMGLIAFRADIPPTCHIFKQLLFTRNPARPDVVGARCIDSDRYGFFVSRELADAIATARISNVATIDPAMIQLHLGREAARHSKRGPYPADPLFHYRKP